MKIAVVGTGYVGLVTGTCLAESGNDVVCIDKVAAKIEMLEGGRLPIYEPGLRELVHRNRRDGRLRFTTDLAAGIAEAEIVFIAVGTPQGADGARRPVRRLGRRPTRSPSTLNGPKIVVIKSTVPVGTNAELARRMAEVTERPVRRRQQPRVPQGRGGDRRLQQARPRRRRRPPAGGRRACCTSCTPRSSAPTGRSWS